MVDAATRKAVSSIPQLKTNAGPRDKEAWVKRLKEEYMSLIAYVQVWGFNLRKLQPPSSFRHWGSKFMSFFSKFISQTKNQILTGSD